MLRITGIEMGLGKTFVGSEKMMQLNAKVNLVVCQKSKIDDWIDHFNQNYPLEIGIYDLTKTKAIDVFFTCSKIRTVIGVINYDLIWRRPELLKLKNFTLMLDESSLIQNERSKRSKFILKIKPQNVILLSGTPTGGKYERLWSQMRLLGWDISKKMYWNHYVKIDYLDLLNRSIPIVIGYKNVDRLKRKMREYGCQFLKTDEVFDLPEQIFQNITVAASKEYRKFKKDKIVTVGETELVGDTTLTRMLCERQLCGVYSKEKLKAFADLIESTEDRLIVFYNFKTELDQLKMIADKLNRPYGAVNGDEKNLKAYEQNDDSITFVQYQAGAMGLNLQKASRMIFFTLPLSFELYEQSKKRIHRIGQKNHCFYYQLICEKTVEERILETLGMRKDFTEKLFEKG